MQVGGKGCTMCKDVTKTGRGGGVNVNVILVIVIVIFLAGDGETGSMYVHS